MFWFRLGRARLPKDLERFATQLRFPKPTIRDTETPAEPSAARNPWLGGRLGVAHDQFREILTLCEAVQAIRSLALPTP